MHLQREAADYTGDLPAVYLSYTLPVVPGRTLEGPWLVSRREIARSPAIRGILRPAHDVELFSIQRPLPQRACGPHVVRSASHLSAANSASRNQPRM
jgi:hypothetical protein